MGLWNCTFCLPNDLFPFPTSLALSGPSEVYFFKGWANKAK